MAGRYGGYNKYRRGNFNYFDSGDGCMFCTGVSELQESHNRRQCPVFKSLKSNISHEPYVNVELKERDRNGFAAAGFMLWKRTNGHIEFLMAREYRDDVDLLNFLGGKRLRKAETPIEVALKKVDMESGRKLSRTTLKAMGKPPLVHWSGSDSKYALFLFEVTEWNDCEIDILCAGVCSDGVKRLEWISQKNLFSSSFKVTDVHNFAFNMVESLQHPSCNVLKRITDIFDTAQAASRQSIIKSQESKKSQENVEFDFDVIKAIFTSAKTARNKFEEKKKYCWGDIRSAMKVLHKQDLRKLKLRFHPDRLNRQLQRDATELERNVGNKAMQVLNQIVDMVDNPQSAPSSSTTSGGVFNSIAELNEQIKKYQGEEEVEVDEDDVTEAVRAKLSEIKIKR